ncbi:peptidoglycan-binding protein [Actinoplanes sp. NPDC051851]|uniref:efflux RND transporter periplasmic adaptor subunit n=1 Tax=Actinoplanes sp. NPDC051851 TaxID=3154753 RepID=UPI003414F89A
MSTTDTRPEAGVGAGGDSPGRHSAGRARRGLTAVAVLAVVAAAGVTFVVVDPLHYRTEAAATASAPVTTGLATVTKGDLSARTLENGTLGYSGDYDVLNNVSGRLTKMPAVGDVVKAGKTLYKVDGKAVVYLYGAYVPAYRALSWGMEGADVQQLNAALVALKYATKSQIDPESDYFGRQTYYAVRRLQDAAGLSKTGQLPIGQVIFLPTRQIRITKVNGTLGATAPNGSTLFEASSTDREVTVSLNASQQSDVAAGDATEITLPTGKTTPGKVASVGKVATKSDDSTTVTVLIRPTKPKETGTLDQAPVQVSIVSDTVKDALSVPANALLALAGGGYAVEVVDAAGAHRLVGVTTGLFDDSAGKVQVSGDGLAEGQNVVVPTS